MDEIVAAVQMRDFVLLITKHGVVYRTVWDEQRQRVEIILETQINVVGK